MSLIDPVGVALILLLLLVSGAGPLLALFLGVVRPLRPAAGCLSVGWALGVLLFGVLLGAREMQNQGGPVVYLWCFYGGRILSIGLGGATLTLGAAALVARLAQTGWSAGLLLAALICGAATFEVYGQGSLFGTPSAPWWLLAGRGASLGILALTALAVTWRAPRAWGIAGPWLLLVGLLLAPFEGVSARHVLVRERMVAGTELAVVRAADLSNFRLLPLLELCPVVWKEGWAPRGECEDRDDRKLVAPGDLPAARLLEAVRGGVRWVLVRSDRPGWLPGLELYILYFDDTGSGPEISVKGASVQEVVDRCLAEPASSSHCKLMD